MCKASVYNPIRQGLCETASSFSADLRANLYKFENQLQIFKILPVSFSNQVKIDSAYGSVYKGSTLANQNQVVNSVNLIPNKEVLQCPPFQLPDIARKFATALSAAEIECFEGFAVSEELSVKYEEITRDQSLSEDWKRLRKYRLTTSKSFKQICSRKKDFQKLAENFLNGRCVTTAAMLYGLKHENEASKAYAKLTGNNVYSVGIVINPTAPYLSCSPDRRVFDSKMILAERFGLLEIKCPQANSYIELPYLQLKNQGYTLKTNHMYFHQIQGQMGITGAKWCDFMVYCKEDMHLERIKFDKEFFQSMKDKVDTFYFTYFLPAIIKNKI